MPRKESYWRKHQEKTGEPVKDRLPSFRISAEARKEFEDGKVILIDKNLHWTSFDVVRKIRNMIGVKKTGHAGTLDPLATGLLIICTGKFTKKINEYMASEKEYTGYFTMGAVTPTYDLESEPVSQKDYSHITSDMLEEATSRFLGSIEQFPPVYSAIKKDGVALYELARRGEDVELQARKIFINSFAITSVELPRVGFRIICSTGTYIRSMAHDFGQVLGCGAYLSELRRTRIGEFDVDDALTVERFTETLTKDIEPPIKTDS